MIIKLINIINLNLIIFGLYSIIEISCTKIEREPKVVTGTITDITTSSAVAEANLIDLGDGINQHGHCWSIFPNADISDSKTSLGHKTNTGSFTSIITGLTPNTTYFLRAYAESNNVTVYGNQIFFKTADAPVNDVADADGNVYDVVRIGTQVWMSANLKTTKYNDGSNIPLVTDNTTWSNLTTPGYCWYYNDAATYKNAYGALYNWYTVNTGKLCPAGWHVPSDAEWTTLTVYLGGESVAGGKLKSTGTIEGGTGLWYSPNTGATNETGFTAVPGGYRDSDGSFSGIGDTGYWWSSTESSSTYALLRGMRYVSSVVFRGSISKTIGFSVRCVRD